MKVELRDYQAAAFDQAREHIRQGNRRILIVAPTGSGKTVLASAVMEMTRDKGNRANFVVDRLSLISQTSDTFDRYGLDHGVIQADHPRYRPSQAIQICSVQTVSRRGWPEAHLDVFDEAHVLHEAHKARLLSGSTVVIGLTATPFTKGLAKHFDAVVNVTTTRRLIEQGWLSPYRIFSCAEPDMTGVDVKSTGEWDDKQASDRALKVVGDVVKEYLEHGQGRKFICSAVDTAHVDELARQFLAAGINVATYTYKVSDEDRAEITAEFRKPDSTVRGLITVTAASRGFDVPDVSCVIMARPLRKSLAEHIQLFGRGLRISPETGKQDCIARGTLILTDKGEVPVERLTLSHRVWDGVSFVQHGGAVCKGVRPVIEYDGLIATPDHEVMTDDGWTRFEDAARGQRRIARTGVGRCPIRFTDDHIAGLRGGQLSLEGEVALRSLRHNEHGEVLQHYQASRRNQLPDVPRPSPCDGAGVALQARAEHDEPMPEQAVSGVCELRRSRHRVPVSVGERGGTLDRSDAWGAAGSVASTGPQGQQRALRAWEPALGQPCDERQQHAQDTAHAGTRQVHRLSPAVPGGQVRGQDVDEVAVNDDVRRGSSEVLRTALVQAEREVWDVLNAGPLQRFTANGRLVHNCLVLDHSGNAARFFAKTENFFDNGIEELDDGKPKEKKPPPDKPELEPTKCPSCGHLHKPAPYCPACGHEYPRKVAVQHVPGSLKELIAGGHHRELSKQLFPQIAGYVIEHRGRHGDEARRMAQAIYRSMTGEFARAAWDLVVPVPPSQEVINRIRAQQIAYSKARQKVAA